MKVIEKLREYERKTNPDKASHTGAVILLQVMEKIVISIQQWYANYYRTFCYMFLCSKLLNNLLDILKCQILFGTKHQTSIEITFPI